MASVFISYCQESDQHKERIAALATRLAGDGIEVICDRSQPAGGPDEGWNAWSEKQASTAPAIVIAMTETYQRCWEGDEPPGLRIGAKNEAVTIKNRLNKLLPNNPFLRVILFEAGHRDCIPDRLGDYARFKVFEETGYTELVAWLQTVDVQPTVAVEAEESPAINWPSPLPNYDYGLADRQVPFEMFEQMITGQTSWRALMCHGKSNIGKTTLTRRFRHYAKELGLNVCRLDQKGGSRLEDIAGEFEDDFGIAVDPQSRFLERDLYRALKGLTEPSLLIFDTFEQATEPVERWVDGRLLERLSDIPALTIVVAGQRVPDRSKHGWEDMAIAQELPPLTEVADWECYVKRQFPDAPILRAHIEAFIQVAEGNPATISQHLALMANKPA